VPFLFCIIGCLSHFLSLKLWNCPIKYFVTTLLSCSVYMNVCVSSILDIVHIQFCVVKLLSERVQQVKLFILCVLFKCHWSLLLYCRHVLSIRLSWGPYSLHLQYKISHLCGWKHTTKQVRTCSQSVALLVYLLRYLIRF